MHTPTNFDQTNCTGTLAYYNNARSNEYLSDSSSCTDNRSDLGSDDYNDYESNYESDNEEAPRDSTSTIQTPLVQSPNIKERKINVAYTLRQEKFNDNFSSKDLLNAIREIFLSPPRDMSDEKGSLEYLPIYSFLFPNEKGLVYIMLMTGVKWKINWLSKSTKTVIVPRSFLLQMIFLKYMACLGFMNVLTVKNL